MDWKKYGAYKLFDEFIDTFFIKRKSFITTHQGTLNFESGIARLDQCFIQDFVASSEANFETKLAGQFKNASDNEKIIFTNLEYLWAMPASNITTPKKKQYASRWFPKMIRTDAKYFPNEDIDHVADPGTWNNRNKHTEISSLIYLLKYLLGKSPTTISQAKQYIGDFSCDWIYSPQKIKNTFRVPEEVFKKSATQNFMLHLSNPDRYGAIVSDKHKDQIVNTFSNRLAGQKLKREEAIKAIKKAMYADFANEESPDRKERWFFYMDDVRPLWDPKFKGDSPSKTAQKKMMRFAETVDLYDQEYTVKEGDESNVTIIVRKRDSKIVSEVKKRDKYTCQACGFRYEDRIVHVHHLDPLSEQKGIVETKLENLITLCPNCHALAHALLVASDQYKNKKRLRAKLGMIFKRN